MGAVTAAANAAGERSVFLLLRDADLRIQQAVATPVLP